jgi:hypothetical protein
MPPERTYRRLPLRDLITEAEKRARHAAEHIGTTWLARVTDLRDLSRPVRRKSNYPTLLAMQNALQRFVQVSRETDELIAHLEQQCNDIRDHAKRERLNRN